jgi:formylglycine-generating enzyme
MSASASPLERAGQDARLAGCNPRIRIPRKVLEGGSHLCASNYRRGYRPAACFPQPIDTSTCDVGFHCVARV